MQLYLKEKLRHGNIYNSEEREKLLSYCCLQEKVFQLESIYLVFISCVYFIGVRFCFPYWCDKVFPFPTVGLSIYSLP